MSKQTHFLMTGVSSGLGHGMAQAALERGDFLYAMNRSKPEAFEGRESFRFVAADVAEFETLPGKLATLLGERSSLDCVVLNAGMLNELKDMAETSLDEIKRVMDVNVWANKVLLDALFAGGVAVKQVVVISSGAAVSGARGWNAYALSKATLNMLVKLYAAEQPEVHFTALAPGLVDTAMQDEICGRAEYERFPIVQRLKSARGTDSMPDADTAGKHMLEVFPRLLDYDSGSFVDVRKMD